MKLFLKFFFLLTPFFVISMMLAMTPDWTPKKRQSLALHIGISGFIISLVLLFFGRFLFDAFGITVDSFRMGGGLLLLLSGIGLVNSRSSDKLQDSPQTRVNTEEIASVAVVPLAMPIMVGPGTIAALLIVSAELQDAKGYAMTILSLAAAMLAVTILLYYATWLHTKLGREGLAILSKITGLILVAMGAQLVATGLQAFLKP